ncbi:predicted protein [Histoplasma capsulatum G186AR]|uniref:Uncharacterized protein n=1 Tax=Ajellomyces capsulatus (strain G186AR / H82 / ATCC MYA-2454 / RMSCC 2432) TaxID=447093 RepID=C0NTZ4_AJECG|nr:uncharacterized protein HCBG_06624 [Histoplasma capsulatum G186AR]EEH05505.1 predicted protein [Histoplasma capsulatum G186AR]
MKLLLSLVIFAGITTTGHLEIGTATIEPRLDKYGWFEGQAREGLELECFGSWVAGCSAWSLEGRWETWINQIPESSESPKVVFGIVRTALGVSIYLEHAI